MSNFFIHRFLSNRPNEFGTSANAGEYNLDINFIQRIIAAMKRGVTFADGQWIKIVETHSELMRAAAVDNVELVNSWLKELYRSPITTGFQQDKIIYDEIVASGGYNPHLHLNYLDKLIALAEALGALPLQNPERDDHEPFRGLSVDDLCDRIETAIPKFNLVAPKYQAHLYGLRTRRGVFTDRHLIALYVATRIGEIAGENARVCEIGGGMGYVGYFCRALGIRDYTIVDLPSVGMAQTYMLGTSYGTSTVFLSGEIPNDDGFKIINPDDFAVSEDQYDIIVNVDSFPEMATETMHRYIRPRRSRLILSCNQESMAVRTSEADRMIRVGEEIYKIGGYRRLSRNPFWMRRGYVEEVFERLGGKQLG